MQWGAEWSEIHKVLRGKNTQTPRILYPVKLSFNGEWDNIAENTERPCFHIFWINWSVGSLQCHPCGQPVLITLMGQQIRIFLVVYGFPRNFWEFSSGVSKMGCFRITYLLRLFISTSTSVRTGLIHFSH